MYPATQSRDASQSFWGVERSLPTPMTNRTLLVTLLALFAMAQTASAQIASYVDENGKVVYINGDSPEAHGGSSIAGGLLAGQPHVSSGNFGAGASRADDPRIDRIVENLLADGGHAVREVSIDR